MPDPLPIVARIRRLAVDEARLALADCLTTEAAAAADLRVLDAAIAAETDAAADPAGDDRSVEAFAVWLRRIGVERHAAEQALEAAERRTTEARTALAASRAAARAIEEMVRRRDAERRYEADRKEQIGLEEAARHRGG